MRVVPNFKMGDVPFGVPIVQAVQGTPRHFSEPTPYTPRYNANSGPRNNSWGGNGHYSGGYSGSHNGNGYHHRKNNNYSFSHGSPSRQAQGPQVVELWKIENGMDVRTTIMLRNIPNKMNCHDLKALLDQHCAENYDFSYLRIDFEKGTNVGYAFVNFSDPMHIIPFVVNHAGKRWQPDNARKVELSYATVQGYDCLVEKFRNSAIMSEYKDYRPKLWHSHLNAPTWDVVGKEAPFPPPNNMSKKQRSMDNAGSIGLYAPRANHNNRERGRHSQFDRGTPSQVQHDKYYNGMSPSTGGNYTHGSSDSFTNGGYHGGQNGYVPRINMMAPPPQFAPVYYNNGYATNGYVDGSNGYSNQQAYGYGQYAGGDVFAPNNGGYVNGYQGANGYQNANGYHGDNGYQQSGYQQNGYQQNGYQNANGYQGTNGYQNGNAQYVGYHVNAYQTSDYQQGGQFGTGPNTPASRLRTQTNGRLGGRPRRASTHNGQYQSNGRYSPEYAAPLSQVAEAPEDEGYNNVPGPTYCPHV